VAKVAESRIDLIKKDMPASFEIEGLPGVKLEGKVIKVNEYPVPDNWFNANVKEYATTIQVNDPPAGLRPGMTAKVAIRVETLPDVLQVPIQAVVQRGGKHYCLLARPGVAIEPREVLIGSTNEKFLVIRDGLSRDDLVLMNPRVHMNRLHFPEAEEAAGDEKLAARREKPAAELPPKSPPLPATNGGPGS